MRKDVKIGLAVGGILFVVVLSYALFFTGPKNKQTAQAPGSGSPPAAAPANPDPSRPTPAEDAGSEPVNPPGGSGLSVLPPPSITTPPASGTDTVTIAPPSPLPSPGVSGGNTDWNALLHNGENAASRLSTPSGAMEVPTAVETGTTPSTPVLISTPPTITPTLPATLSGPNRTHAVKAGENYWKIAEAEYGSGTYMSHLISANPQYPPQKLRVGVSIVVPPREQVVPAAARAVTATTRPVDPAREYRVKAGDNLYNISTRLYGKADRVEKIYELNKDKIGHNPGALKPNMVLQLPEPPKSLPTGGVADIR